MIIIGVIDAKNPHIRLECFHHLNPSASGIHRLIDNQIFGDIQKKKILLLFSVNQKKRDVLRVSTSYRLNV